MVEAIGTVEQVMGDGLKGPKPSELDNLGNCSEKSGCCMRY